ncbi:protein of unknown function [Aminobacter niigataensis]|nr:protein of unknown function [Aminobacter niigataensis]
MKPEQFVGVQAMSISERKYYERVTREMHAEARALLAARPKRVIREKP